MQKFFTLTLICILLAAPAHARFGGNNPYTQATPSEIKADAVPPAKAAVAVGKPLIAILNRRELSDTELLSKYKIWQALHASDTPLDFDTLKQFVNENPDWPENDTLVKRAEIAIITSHVGDNDIREWFALHPPVTELGKLEAAHHDGSMSADLIRKAWVEANFNESREAGFLEQYGPLIRTEDYIDRASRLVWDNQFPAVKRIMEKLPEDHRLMIKARIDLRNNTRFASYSVAQVPTSLATDPGLLYDRIVWHNVHDDRSGARELLLYANSDAAYPDKWWLLRERGAREAIQDKEYTIARRILSHHALMEGKNYQEALFLSGWLYLEFQDSPREAYKEFNLLNDAATTPHSKARAEYWGARAAEKTGNTEIAKKLYRLAAEYPTTYHGQLALTELNEESYLRLPPPAIVLQTEKNAFMKQELPRLVILLAAEQKTDETKPFILDLASNAIGISGAALSADLGTVIGRPDFRIAAAKRAFQNGYLATDRAYPIPKITISGDVEKPLVIGLIRQESQFYPFAQSPSGAMGLMQLMRGTAKEIARKNNIRFNKDRLFDLNYNVQLGSIYLAKLLSHNSGSYILSIAAYNAGPGRVDQWSTKFGHPPARLHDAVDWVEKIPYSETRTYVQRVLENTQIYRELLEPGSKLKLEEDLKR